jgi:peptidoglycan/xylan/chitin deacetylase (PgdA/CDA1 family)
MLKRAMERALVAIGAAELVRGWRQGQGLILAYHDIMPDGATPTGDRSLHLPRRMFARHLDMLARTHDVVSLADLLAGRSPRRRPAAVITFDDAYRGALTAGVAELTQRGLPATIFVAPAFVGGHTFWWDAIVRPSDPQEDAQFREYALSVLGGDDARVRAWALARGYQAADPPDWACCASEAELRSAAEHAGITFGAHSWSHPNLALLDGERLTYELTAPRAWLRERFERVVDCLAYPYGLFSPAVARAAAAAGYRLSLRVDGGWLHFPYADPMATPRCYVPAEISPEGFALRTAGLICR